MVGPLDYLILAMHFTIFPFTYTVVFILTYFDGIADELNDAHDRRRRNEDDGGINSVESVHAIVQISMLAESTQNVAKTRNESRHLGVKFVVSVGKE